MSNKVKDFSQKALKVLLTFAVLLSSASSSVVTAYEADTAKVEEAFESIENEVITLGETDGDEPSDEIIVEESQEGLEQEEQIEEDEAPLLGETNADGGQVGGISDGEIEEADYWTPYIADTTDVDTVDVGDFDNLQSQITGAPTDGTLRIINIIHDIEFENVIVIPAGTNITIESTGDYTLTQESGRHFNVGANGSLTLQEGVTLNGNLQGGGVQVAGPGAMFTMNGGTISENRSSIGIGGGGVYVVNSGEFTMNNGTISENSSSGTGGGVVNISNNGIFTMNGGTISDNSHDSNANGGGGVYIARSMFTMNNGTIKDNNAGAGGGVYVHSDSEFIMRDGTISGNRSSIGIGGGVSVLTNGKFTMSGGEITDNEAFTIGGGVHVNGDGVRGGGEFIMRDGTIRDNRATRGGGVNVNDGGEFIMRDGTISENTAISSGGGVHLASLSANENAFTVGANVQFSGNKANVAVHPPANATSLFPNIQGTSSSSFNYPLNNYDIGFTNSDPILTQRTLTAMANGGHIRLVGESENLSSLVLFGGEVPIEIEALPAPGYEFVEWESSDGGSFTDATNINTVFTTPDANTTITAVFVERVYNDVTFEGNGGEIDGALHYVLESVPFDTEFHNLNHPIAIRNNWDFADWYDESSGGDAILPTHIIEGDETVYAQWNASVRFMMNDGSTTKPIDQRSIREGDAIGALPGDPTRDHYMFDGWHTAAGEIVDEYFKPTNGHVNVYAQWEAIEIPGVPPIEEWTVTFMDGERVVALQTVEDESLLNEPEALDRAGYVFEGWYEGAPLFTGVLRAITQRRWDFENDRVIGDITLQARWSEVIEEDERSVNPTQGPVNSTLPGLPQTGAITTGVLLGGWVLTVSGVAIASKKRKDKE